MPSFLKKGACTFLLALLCKLSVLAQVGIQVVDSNTLFPIAGAALLVNQVPKGSSSLKNGIIILDSITLKNSFSIFALGYQTHVSNGKDVGSNNTIYLKPLYYALADVVILDSLRIPVQNKIRQIGIDPSAIEKLPSFLGEPDLLKSLQLLPGVSGVIENNVGLSVRGGKPEYTHIKIDGATIYNPAHSVGFFSTLHPAAVHSATLYNEGIPSNYGSRASAFLDVNLKEGNYNSFQGTASIGAISSYLDVQGPLSKGKVPTSIQFVGRTTYIDRVVKLVAGESNFVTGFSDYSIKITSKLTDKAKLSLAYYRSSDYFRLENINLLNFGSNTVWQNNIVSLNYMNSLSDSWLLESRLSLSTYTLGNSLGQQAVHASGIRDIGWNYGLTSFKENRLLQKVGIEILSHSINPGRLESLEESFFDYDDYQLNIQQSVEVMPYATFSKELSQRSNFISHIRLGSYFYNNTLSMQPEPRLVFERTSRAGLFSLSYDRLSQFLSLYSTNITPMPTDIWISSNDRLPPTVSNSVTLSWIPNKFDSDFDFKVSTYFRRFSNFWDIKDGSPAYTQPRFQSNLAIGTNHSYGLEIFIQKKVGTLTGWLSYTLSRSLNTIEEIKTDGSYAANFDKPHVLNLVLNKRYKKWELNSVFTLQSGRPIKLPESSIGNIIFYSERNEYRLPYYHRLDLSAVRYQKRHRHYQAVWTFGVVNAYNRKNVYAAIYNPISENTEFLSLFPIIPSISYRLSMF